MDTGAVIGTVALAVSILSLSVSFHVAHRGRPHLKVFAEPAYLSTDGVTRYIAFDVANDGGQPEVVTYVAVQSDLGKHMYLMDDVLDRELPLRLEVGDGLKGHAEIGYLHDRWKREDRGHVTHLVVSTASSRTYRHRLHQKVRRLIEDGTE